MAVLFWVIIMVVSGLAELHTSALAGLIALKKLHHPAGDLAHPMDTALTGQFGVVEHEVGDEIHPGRIKIRGESWRAVADSGSIIAVATPVVVTRAYGTTLYVHPR